MFRLQGCCDLVPYRIIETEGILVHQIQTEDPWDPVAHRSYRVDKPLSHLRLTRVSIPPIHAGGVSIPQLRRGFEILQHLRGREFRLKISDMFADHLIDSCFIRHEYEKLLR